MADSRQDYAEHVGHTFVQKYYHTLHHKPSLAHRFYQDMSKLGRPNEDGSMTITTTLQAIRKKIGAFNYNDFRAEIKSVNAQDSFNGGVQVLVTGCLTGRQNAVRNFTQVFFLVLNDDGTFFVLNDMFQYVDSVTNVVAAEQAPTEYHKNNKNKKKLTSLNQKFEQQCSIGAEGNDREFAQQQHRDSMKSYLQKAVFSVLKIQSDSVKSYLKKVASRVLRKRSKSALEGDERDSLETFAEKNKSMRNTITFDLHGQKVKQAMKLVKSHLVFGAYYRSVLSFKVITGRGKHSVDGVPKLKNSIIGLLKKEGISWREEKNNPGALLVELNGQTKFGFLHSGSHNTK